MALAVEKKPLWKGAASHGPVRNWLGLSFFTSREFCVENANFICLQEVVKELEDCRRLSPRK
jgi:hypothetical protein